MVRLCNFKDIGKILKIFFIESLFFYNIKKLEFCFVILEVKRKGMYK